MDEIKARSLVKKLIKAAWEAGRYSTNPNSLILKDSQKKAEGIGDEIIRHLTNSDDD
ncbi:MAG: hypothetical protein Q7J27_07850 [Syntrophales bacterium]|nr:hypothetical protein [Syntrophales bacterium]